MNEERSLRSRVAFRRVLRLVSILLGIALALVIRHYWLLMMRGY